MKKTQTDKQLIRRLLEISYKNKLHHLGSYFSSIETIDEIYSNMKENDIFILSNGHAAVALYVVLEKYFGFNAQHLLDEMGEHPKRNEQRKSTAQQEVLVWELRLLLEELLQMRIKMYIA